VVVCHVNGVAVFRVMEIDPAVARIQARLWQAYRDFSRDLQRAFDRQLERDAGLSGADYALLVPLPEARDGVVRMRGLGQSVGWDRSRLSHQVRRMEQRGLVVREE
jgi:DNA-binding MarR family transcriptional regulator